MDVKEIGAFEAKTKLSELLEQVERGRTFRIMKRGEAVAELRPIASKQGPRFGSDRGRVMMSKDFDNPIADFKRYR